MSRRLTPLCWMVALVGTDPAAGEEPERSSPIAVLDLRPLHSGPRRETDLDLLPEAVEWSKQLRAALSAGGQRKVLSSAELRTHLGPNWRVQSFSCREQLRCLRPLLAKLPRVGVRRALLGTLRAVGDQRTVDLLQIDLEALTIVSRASFELAAGGSIPPDVVARLLGGPPPAPTAAPTPAPPSPAPPKEAPPPPAEDDGGDVVESIGGAETQTPVAAPPQPPADRFQVSGWVRTIAEIGFYTRGYHAQRPDALAPPYDPLVLRSHLLVRARYSRGRWFEIGTAAALGYSLFEQSPADPDATFNLFNGQSARGELDPQLVELYLGFFTKRFDLRIGQQRVAWGRADSRSPNDVVNGRDLRDPLLAEQELAHLATPVIRGDLDLGFGVLQMIVAPFFLPDRFEIYGTNWSTLQPDAPAPLRGFFGLASRAVDPTLVDKLQPLLGQTSLPRLTFADPSAGARFSWTWRRLDVSHYYYYGFDGTPVLAVDPAFARTLASTDWQAARLADLAPVLQMIDAGQRPFTATYLRRHHVGLDAVTIVGPFALRLDAAFDSSRAFYQSDLASFVTPALEGVLSIEYQTGDAGKFIIVEGIYLHLFDPPPLVLLGQLRDSVGVAVAARWTFWKRLELGVRGLVGILPFSYAVVPELGLRLGVLQLRAGGQLLGGDDFSFGSYFRRNNSLYLLAKYSF